MIPTITAFERSPDRGRGLARDMRVRWALEEVGQPYDVRLVSFSEMKEPAHLRLHPFGQIPTYEEGELALFESGAIILHIAQRHAGLLPDDANARMRAIAWMFAALNTVEPPILDREIATLVERDKSWYQARQPILDDRVHVRLGELSTRLGDADWLDDAFSAGDLLMVTVLRRLSGSAVLQKYPNLSAYIERGEARPAYKRAFADQLAVFTGQAADLVRFLVGQRPGKIFGYVQRTMHECVPLRGRGVCGRTVTIGGRVVLGDERAHAIPVDVDLVHEAIPHVRVVLVRRSCRLDATVRRLRRVRERKCGNQKRECQSDPHVPVGSSMHVAASEVVAEILHRGRTGDRDWVTDSSTRSRRFDQARFFAAFCFGRRMLRTLPLLPPPQKKRSLPSDSSPDTCTPDGMSRHCTTSPV